MPWPCSDPWGAGSSCWAPPAIPPGPARGKGPAIPARPATQIALTVLDVRDPGTPRLAQRLCLSVPGADRAGTRLDNAWALGEVHKLLGMFSEGNLNILSIPIWFAQRQEVAEPPAQFFYRWTTAVSLVTWDLSRYAENRPAAEQIILRSQGIVQHPEGEVTRSIVFRHPVTGERSMINLSDSHLSVASIENLAQPRLESSLEVAPAVFELLRFGDFIVERVDIGGGRWSADGAAEFRVKRAGGPIDGKEPAATFRVGQAREAYRHKHLLVVLRSSATPAQPVAPTEAVIFDLQDPTRPRLASRLTLPFTSTLYQVFMCGGSPDWGYWFGQTSDSVWLDIGMVRMYFASDGTSPYSGVRKLAVLDLRNPDAPSVFDAPLPESLSDIRSLVADTSSPNGFYLVHRKSADPPSSEYRQFQRLRYFAQRWDVMGNTLAPDGGDINLPGHLARTWRDAGGQRLFLAGDSAFRGVDAPDQAQWHADARLHLLRQTGSDAELITSHEMPDRTMHSLIFDGSRLFLGVRQLPPWSWRGNPDQPWQTTSDRLLTFDLSGAGLSPAYDQPIRANETLLMGLHDNHLFIQLGQDGVLATDVSDLARPRGARFLPTLGYVSHVEFVRSEAHTEAGTVAYLASGSYGTFHFELAPAP